MSDSPTAPRWLSIKDAAAYLAVGEPTLFRWMRDGRITFRKVGDSTRFLQEDLDALVEVHPSARDADKVKDFCPLCHQGPLVPGHLQSTGLIYFRPRGTKFWSLRTADVATEARMCAHCGHVSWFGDTKKLTQLLEKRAAAESAAADAAADAAVSAAAETDDAAAPAAEPDNDAAPAPAEKPAARGKK